MSTAATVVEDRPVDERTAWSAVQARDPRFDGRLVYAVSSTGVYCRPSCPSRRPRRENVAFFATPDEAEAAGFRECRRCRPRGMQPSPAARSVQRAREYLDAHPEESVTLERLGRVAAMSPHHLQRVFKRLVGVSPQEYAAARRAERLREHLREGASVSRAGFEAGYGSGSRLYEHAEARLGMTPAAYRRGGQGVRIRFALAPSPLGRILVAATERGVCAVRLGDSDGEMEEALREEFPRATIEPGGEELAGWVAAVVASLEGSGPDPDLPLDVRATAFQWRVWRALREIPRGSTRSYREIAEAIGSPGAARAVGRACATNPVALVIPCHRAVREDGGLSGYRWGVERKQRLLEREREPAG
ncbi:MAG TPA: bifunctional DNA-binding transcriptional regulator/O6-methylguanine-DNA methyltransferase Ada [Longimicrobiaceae bacterium]|nr:bifunctional DNA-binding transcriptional regulator/O6-methylguanine-DNA methyltransferase Ada [Longimicrobiaceae bacterium]